GAARSGGVGGGPRAPPGLLRRARHRARLLAPPGARRAGRGLQPLLGHLVGDPAGAGLPPRPRHREGHRGQDGPYPSPPLRRDDPRGRSVEGEQGHGMEGGDSLRAHPHGAPGLLAAADPRVLPLNAAPGAVMATGRMPDDRAAAGARIADRIPRGALVHDWLTGMRGGGRGLEAFCELFPSADLFTLLRVPGSVSPVIERRRIVSSFLERLPGAREGYRRLLPLFPAAVRGLDLGGRDLVLSS